MLYNKYKELKLPALAFGAMRLPLNGDGKDDADVDREQAYKMVDYAMENGVNYFDTAYGYHEGNSQIVLAEALKKYPRESYMLANKFPGYELDKFGHVEEVFEEQLEKCGVEYFDFYLLHNVNEMNLEQYLDEEKYGTVAYLLEQKKKGRIKHLGFSTHAKLPRAKEFLERFADKMEFAQIQLNYFDWKFQQAKEMVELLSKYNLPVWVMEPMRGGKLAHLDEKYEEKLKKLRPGESIASWALRFLQSLPEVVTVLSGWSELEQTKENIAVMSEAKPLNKDEMDTLMGIVDEMLEADTVPCTACRYCTEHCPKGLDIPDLIDMYNQNSVTRGDFIAYFRMSVVPKDKKPSACIACKKCEQVCPQGIKVSEIFKKFAEKRRWA